MTATANEGTPAFHFVVDPAPHDAWFRTKVHEALNDTRPAIPNEDVATHFARRRAAAGRKASGEA